MTTHALSALLFLKENSALAVRFQASQPRVPAPSISRGRAASRRRQWVTLLALLSVLPAGWRGRGGRATELFLVLSSVEVYLHVRRGKLNNLKTLNHFP